MDCRKRRVLPEIKQPDRRLKEIARLEDRSAESSTRVSDVIRTDTKSALPNEPTQQEPAKGNGETSATVPHDEAETAPAELEVARAPEEPRVESPLCKFEYIFVPDIMRVEALPEFLERVSTRAHNYPAASSPFQEGQLHSAGPETAACLKPAHEDIPTSDQSSPLRNSGRPGTSRIRNFAIAVTAPQNNWKRPIETRKLVYRRCSRGVPLKTTHSTRRKKTDLGTQFNSLLKSHRNTRNRRLPGTSFKTIAISNDWTHFRRSGEQFGSRLLPLGDASLC